MVDRLHERGIRPKQHILDNECSEDFKSVIKENKMTYQLVPPHDHCQNIAEKAIQTFKLHFVSILCSINKSFPLQLWCQLIRQAEHTLNLLRPSRMTPTVSAYAHLWNQHNYNAQPFALLGCRVEAYLYPTICNTWKTHTATEYYIGNSHEHYRFHKIYILHTRSNPVCDTVFFQTQVPLNAYHNPRCCAHSCHRQILRCDIQLIPKSSITKDAILQLIAIFRIQALAASDTASAQRVLREIAATQ